MSNKYVWIERLKKRWGIYSNFQIVLILIVFSLTGFSTLYIEKLILDLIDIGGNDQWWMAILIFLFITLPVYNIVLLVYGTLFGQFKFFWNFERRFFGRIFGVFVRKKS